MTNVSYQKIEDDDYKIAYEQLAKLIGDVNKKKAKYFLDELLTESERVMLVKRFAATMMFTHNYSIYRVSKTVGISISTSQRLYGQFLEGKFDGLVSCLSKAEKNKFLQLIQMLILAQVDMKARAKLTKQILS